MKKVILLLFLGTTLIASSQLLWAQTAPEKPYSFTHKLKKKVATEKLDADKAYQKFLKEKNPFAQDNHYLGQYDTDAKMNLLQHGTWEKLPNGDHLWRIKLSSDSKLLTGIGVHADKSINIPQGAKLFFYSDDRKYVVGPITEPNVKNAKQLLVNTIPGKSIWIEYYEPLAQKGKSVFNIDAVLYRYVKFPYSFAHPLSKEVPFVDLVPRIRVEAAKRDLPKVPVGQLANLSTGGIYRNCFDMGVWEDLPNGDRIWRMGFESDIAFGMSFQIKMKIPEGAYVVFYSLDKMYVGSVFDKPLDNLYYTLGTGAMPGNKYVMEYYEPKYYRNDKSIDLKIIDLEYDLTKWVMLGSNSRGPEAEVACSPNVTCACNDFDCDTTTTDDNFCGTALPVMNGSNLDTNFIPKLKRSVVRFRLFFPCTNQNDPLCQPAPDNPNIMVFNPITSQFYASGSLINNQNNETFVLSANHVLNPPSTWVSTVDRHYVGDALHWIADFNFETTCNNFLLPSTPIITSVKGATAVAGNSHYTPIPTDFEEQSSSDFLLLKLKTPVPATFTPHYAGWDAATQTLPSIGLNISHPRGFDKRIAIQDDAVNLIANNPNNGIKPFSSGNLSANHLSDINQNQNGEQFAVTYDRGATRPSSSGSPYFNAAGRIIGNLSGGHVECALNDTLSFPNYNNNKLEKFGRFWYYYDSYPQGNQMGAPKVKVTDIGSPGGASIDSYEKTRTLISWLPDGDGIMDGLAVSNCDIYMRDCPSDMGVEPNICNMGVASPDLWNSTVNLLDPNDAVGTVHEMPDFKDANGNHLDNYISVKVRNNSTACTSPPATLRLYWSMASTGLQWPDSWNAYDIGIGSTCIAGNEIGKDCYATDIQPHSIPALNPGQVFSDEICWLPPNFTDPNADQDYYPYQNPNFCSNLQAQSISPISSTTLRRYAISLLARVVSLDNPTAEEQGSIMNNVKNSNNVTLRNTFLADLSGTPHILWVHSSGSTNVVFREVQSLIEGGDSEALSGLLNVELLPGADLWSKWESTGFKGEGVEIVSDGIVKITNFEIAKLLDIPLDGNQAEPLAVRVTIINPSGKLPYPNNVPNKYAFAISHEATNPTGNEPESSPCIVELNDIHQHLSNTTNETASIQIQPNPFNNETQISFTLPKTSQASLLIYDLKGQTIKTFFQNETFQQGTYTYTLSEPDLPAGMYITALQTPTNITTAKLVKMK